MRFLSQLLQSKKHLHSQLSRTYAPPSSAHRQATASQAEFWTPISPQPLAKKDHRIEKPPPHIAAYPKLHVNDYESHNISNSGSTADTSYPTIPLVRPDPDSVDSNVRMVRPASAVPKSEQVGILAVRTSKLQARVASAAWRADSAGRLRETR